MILNKKIYLFIYRQNGMEKYLLSNRFFEMKINVRRQTKYRKIFTNQNNCVSTLFDTEFIRLLKFQHLPMFFVMFIFCKFPFIY